MESELISKYGLLATLMLIPAAHIVPSCLARNRVDQIGSSWTLALLACLTFLISHFCMPLKYNIRVDLVIIPPLLLELFSQTNQMYKKFPH